MMAPNFERARVLQLVIDRAAELVDEPIDSVVITDRQVFVSAGRKRLAGPYHYNNAYDADGSLMPGSGRWQVDLGERPDALPGSSWLARLFGR